MQGAGVHARAPGEPNYEMSRAALKRGTRADRISIAGKRGILIGWRRGCGRGRNRCFCCRFSLKRDWPDFLSEFYSAVKGDGRVRAEGNFPRFCLNLSRRSVRSWGLAKLPRFWNVWTGSMPPAPTLGTCVARAADVTGVAAMTLRLAARDFPVCWYGGEAIR